MNPNLQRLALILCSLLSMAVPAQGTEPKIQGEIIHGPAAGLDNDAWLLSMQQWRDKRRTEIHYDAAQYSHPKSFKLSVSALVAAWPTCGSSWIMCYRT
jgi:hypothetical protein